MIIFKMLLYFFMCMLVYNTPTHTMATQNNQSDMETAYIEERAKNAEEVQKRDLEHYAFLIKCLVAAVIIVIILILLVLNSKRPNIKLLLALSVALSAVCLGIGYYKGKYDLILNIEDNIIIFLRKSFFRT